MGDNLTLILGPAIDRAMKTGELPEKLDASDWEIALTRRRRDVYRLRWFAGTVSAVFLGLHLYLLASGSGRLLELYAGTALFAGMLVFAILQPFWTIPKVDNLLAELEARSSAHVL